MALSVSPAERCEGRCRLPARDATAAWTAAQPNLTRRRRRGLLGAFHFWVFVFSSIDKNVDGREYETKEAYYYLDKRVIGTD